MSTEGAMDVSVKAKPVKLFNMQGELVYRIWVTANIVFLDVYILDSEGFADRAMEMAVYVADKLEEIPFHIVFDFRQLKSVRMHPTDEGLEGIDRTQEEMVIKYPRKSISMVVDHDKKTSYEKSSIN